MIIFFKPVYFLSNFSVSLLLWLKDVAPPIGNKELIKPPNVPGIANDLIPMNMNKNIKANKKQRKTINKINLSFLIPNKDNAKNTLFS